jgi:AraC-like DNA-binding protein
MNSPLSVSKQSRALVTQLEESDIFRDYQDAFRHTTGLPLNLRAAGAFNLPHRQDPNQNPFCALMAKSNHTCAACLQLQARMEEEANMEPKTLKCFAGLCDSSVPVRVEKVKNLLLNPHKRVSEAAFEAGFQSLSQFNRVFRRVAGEAPTAYRDKLHGT